MLALTPNAAQVIDAIVSQPGVPDSAGLRLTSESSSENTNAPERELRVSLVESPEEGDEVLEGAPVYVEPEAAGFLEDKVLDADVAEQQVRFSLRDQA